MLGSCSTVSLESILCPCSWITTNTNEKIKQDRQDHFKMFNLRTPPLPVMPVHMMVVMASTSAGVSNSKTL